MPKRKPMKRGAVSSAESEFVAAWIPKLLVAEIDAVVQMMDTDRSKFLRAAVREKLSRVARAA
jgi:metal-responsive CopG/Arc/MetJ family transcriptional regulator